MRRNGRPIRKCGKCQLNFKTHCGLYDDPHEMWSRNRKCPGHMNPDAYQQYLDQRQRSEKQQADRRTAERRRHVAKMHHTKTHSDGRLDPANRSAGQ